MTQLNLLKRSRRLLAASFFVAAAMAIGVAPTTAVAQDAETSVQVSPGQARAIARQALAQGNLPLADGIASALLQRDPQDAEALLIRALAARAAGAFDLAEDAAAQAYAVSDNPALRFDAAFLVADIKTRREQFTRAQMWLRRADNVATDDARRTAATRAYQDVARRNPLSMQLSFSIQPSNNINGGSTEVADGLGGLSGSLDDPIGGIEASASVALKFRLNETPQSLTEAYVNFFVRKAFLESGYADIVAGATSTDYDFASLAIGLERKSLPFEDLGVTTFRIGYRGGYYKNNHYLSAADVGVSQEFRLTENRKIRAGLTLRNETRFDSPAASNVNASLSLDYFPAPSETLSWTIGTTLTNYNSQAPTVEGQRVELRTRLLFQQEILAAKPDLSLSFAWRDLPEFDYFGTLANGRQDISANVQIGLTFQDVSYFGFQPRLELKASATNGEVDIFDTKAFSFGITAVSRF